MLKANVVTNITNCSFIFVCLSYSICVCLSPVSRCLSGCRFVFTPVLFCLSRCIGLSVFLHMHLSLSLFESVCFQLSLSICLSVCQSVSLIPIVSILFLCHSVYLIHLPHHTTASRILNCELFYWLSI